MTDPQRAADPLPPDRPLARSAATVAAAIGGAIVILHRDRGSFHGLSDIGARIWELLDRPASPAAITAALLDEYDVDPETCRRQATDFLEELRTEGLVAPADAPAA